VCTAVDNRKKSIKTLYFGSSGSFKVIDADMTEKLVTSACCDRQHAHAYMQPFSQKTGPQQYITIFMEVPLFGALEHRCP